MIRAFWQSRLAAWAALLACAGVIVLVWVRNAGRPVYIPILATVLAAGIGLTAGRLAGNLIAGSRNVKLLGLLHVELDPKAFLQVYAGVPGHLPEKSLERAITCAYLAEGYAADGQFDKALETMRLPENCKNKKQLAAIQGMYWQKLCSYQLFRGNLPEAKKALQALDGVILGSGSAKESLLANLKDGRRLLQNRIAAQSNKQVELGWLESQLKKAPYQLMRLEILQALAAAALRDGETEQADRYLDRLIDEGGKTFYPRWAQTQKENAPKLGA